VRRPGALLALLAPLAGTVAAQAPDPARLSPAGVTRAAAVVDSVFLDRTAPAGRISGGDWASYMLARLGAGPIPDSLGILVRVDTARIEVRGRLQDLPLEARDLLGPLAAAVDSTTEIVADVALERTGREVARFWLRGLFVNGYRFPEFLLAPMMARVGRQYPALTRSGRDLYVQVPPDGGIALAADAVQLTILPAPVEVPARSSSPPQEAPRW
jgi:hypothetical protein